MKGNEDKVFEQPNEPNGSSSLPFRTKEQRAPSVEADQKPQKEGTQEYCKQGPRAEHVWKQGEEGGEARRRAANRSCAFSATSLVYSRKLRIYREGWKKV